MDRRTMLLAGAAALGVVAVASDGAMAGSSTTGKEGDGDDGSAVDSRQDFIDASTVTDAVNMIEERAASAPGQSFDRVNEVSGVVRQDDGTDVGIDLDPVNDPVRHDGPTMTLGTGADPFGNLDGGTAA